MGDPVGSDALRAALVTSNTPWQQVEHHVSIASTNARAAELARPWRVVVADHQSAGRGRMLRPWESPAGASLLVSATVPLPAAGVGWLPLLTGTSVRAAVEETTGLTAELKWPNDVLLPADGSRKVCGILCEVVAAPTGGDPVVVVGVGLNLRQSRKELPVPTATSLALAGGLAGLPDAGGVDRVALLVSLLGHLTTAYAALAAGGAQAAAARRAYREACSTIGRRVRVSRVAADDVEGEAVAVDDDGRLVVEVGGTRTAWAAGDVVHVRPSEDAGALPG